MSSDREELRDTNQRERTILQEPGNGTVGLAVSYDPNPGPHETEIVVEQLSAGRAEPVYVGGAAEAMDLVSALADYAKEDAK